MANGVPEHKVWAAADAVLARGERPTVERVRTELGRGSPARVGQLLEHWWEQLALRLKGHTLLPELPGDVAQAFAEAWRLALAHAGTTAEAALTEQQNALFAAQTSLTQERKLWEIALSEARADLTESTSKLAHMETQLLERQGLVDQLTREADDLRHQRTRLQEQLERQEGTVTTLRTEHAALQMHIRNVEDRAHQEVDRARTEARALKVQLDATGRATASQMMEITQQRDAALSALRIAETQAAREAGRASALEEALRKPSPPTATKRPAKASTAKPKVATSSTHKTADGAPSHRTGRARPRGKGTSKR